MASDQERQEPADTQDEAGASPDVGEPTTEPTTEPTAEPTTEPTQDPQPPAAAPRARRAPAKKAVAKKAAAPRKTAARKTAVRSTSEPVAESAGPAGDSTTGAGDGEGTAEAAPAPVADPTQPEPTQPEPGVGSGEAAPARAARPARKRASRKATAPTGAPVAEPGDAQPEDAPEVVSEEPAVAAASSPDEKVVADADAALEPGVDLPSDDAPQVDAEVRTEPEPEASSGSGLGSGLRSAFGLLFQPPAATRRSRRASAPAQPPAEVPVEAATPDDAPDEAPDEAPNEAPDQPEQPVDLFDVASAQPADDLADASGRTDASDEPDGGEPHDVDQRVGTDEPADDHDLGHDDGDHPEDGGQPRRRRRRGGKGRRGRGTGGSNAAGGSPADDEVTADGETGDETSGPSSPADQRDRRRSGRRGQNGAGPESGEGVGGVDGTGHPADDDHLTAGSGDQEGRDGGAPDSGESDDSASGDGGTSRRRTRRRRRSGSGGDGDDSPGVITRVREARAPRESRTSSRNDEVTGVKGSTRLEAKKQRRREGREAGRRRTIITEAEFLARRESVERVMVVRHKGGRTQIGVLEDQVLVEHYISRETNVSMAGNIYLGRVQNVLPSMEAAFVDIGKGRNAVLYAGEVNWDAAGLNQGQPKRIEHALSSGQSVLVQVTKDPIGHKGARLTSQISLPGRYLVYVPNSSMTGISRKLPDTERARLKRILKEVVPDTAGVIVRTAAEGASEEELRADVQRLTATWDEIQAKVEAAGGSGKGKKGKGGATTAPSLLHGEPDLTVRVIRDIFNEDFSSLVVAGQEAWDEVSEYVDTVAPDLASRVSRWTREDDLFTHYRVDEQIAKAMDRKVWLPSGGSLVIDRTEAMTVVDVNTGKFVGSGGNLEETVTKNNIEAAEEIVRQLRLRDIGGIIVVDFIDMVLEANRDLVVRRLLECLGRDRTKHQVAEVTSLGLVQMTRKRVGSGLIEVFGETCEHCAGRGFVIHTDPVDRSNGDAHAMAGHGSGGHDAAHGSATTGSGSARGGRSRRGRSGETEPGTTSGLVAAAAPPVVRGGPTPAQIAAAAHAAALKVVGGDVGGDVSGEGGEHVGQDLSSAAEVGHGPDHEGADQGWGEVTAPEVDTVGTVDTVDVEKAVEEALSQALDAVAREGRDRHADDQHADDQHAAGGAEPDYGSGHAAPNAAAPEPGAEPAAEPPAEAPVVVPPPRRRRGRVVAPAGPPPADAGSA